MAPDSSHHVAPAPQSPLLALLTELAGVPHVDHRQAVRAAPHGVLQPPVSQQDCQARNTQLPTSLQTAVAEH